MAQRTDPRPSDVSTVDAPEVEGADLVQSFDRGLRVLEALSVHGSPLALSEVARLCDTTRATARRLLITLVELGHVADLGGSFCLRPRVMRLGDAYLDALGLPEVAHRHLEVLAATVQDTCSLTVLDGDDVVYVDRVRGPRIMTVNIEVGTRFPAYATSTGRVLLASLAPADVARYLADLSAQPLTAKTTTAVEDLADEIEQARANRFVIADGELDVSLRSVAVPVTDAHGHTVAALNVSTHVTRTPLDKLRRVVLPEVLAAAADIGRELDHVSSSPSVRRVSQ